MLGDKKYVQSFSPDTAKLAELLIKAKGNRTMAVFSQQSGLNTSTLSRIANAKITNPLTLEVLKTIYDNKCPDADITEDMLLFANGMTEEGAVDRGKAFVERFVSTQAREISNERHAKNAIVSEMLSRDIIVQGIHGDYDKLRDARPYGIALPYDFTFYVPEAHEQLWYFLVLPGKKNLPAGAGETFYKAGRYFLIDAWESQFFTNIKVSFVFTNRIVYEQFIRRFTGAPIKAAMSVILINPELESVKEEKWISQSKETPSVLSLPVSDNGGYIATWLDDEFEIDDISNEE